MKCNQVSVVATVKNEYGNLPAWLSAFDRQSIQPREYVIVDGGSIDGTWELLNGWVSPVPKILIQSEGVSISEGRNIGIGKSSGDLVAITDAGTVAETDWLAQITAPFRDGKVDVVSGFFVPTTRGLWQRTLAATTLPDASDVDNETFLPSSRSVAFRRSWFGAGFRYPEWLDFCEDIVFDLQLKRGSARFEFVSTAIVGFEPRRSMRSFFVQYFRYARGDGKAGLFLRRHIIRYVSYSALLITIVRRRPMEIMLIGIFGFVSIQRPIRRLFVRESSSLSIRCFAFAIPLIVAQKFAGDLAKMIGYPVGVIWRLKRFRLGGTRINWRNINPDGHRS